MRPAEYGTCSSCGARVRWVVTRAGERMPLDPELDPAGDVVLERRGDVELALVQPLPKVHAEQLELVLGDPVVVDERPRFRPHWATCPSAEQHRVGAVIRERDDELDELPPPPGPPGPLKPPRPPHDRRFS